MPLEDEWLIYKQEVLAESEDVPGLLEEDIRKLCFYAGAQVALGLIAQRGESPEAVQDELDRFQNELMKTIVDRVLNEP